MKYSKLFDNHPMIFHHAKTLCKSLNGYSKKEQKLAFLSLNCVGHAISQGHVCADLSNYATEKVLEAYDVDKAMPQLEKWLAFLMELPFIGLSGDSGQPFLLIGHRLYLNKYYQWESRLAQMLLAYTYDSSSEIEKPETERLVNDAGEIDWQSVAQANSVLSRLSIVVGGPGTGKTTTVSRILESILQAENNSAYRVALAAPTGKAAARMAQSLQEKITDSDLPEALKQCVPPEAATLHRLLGWSPSSRRFKYNTERPLPYDCIVIDEASMIDMGMFFHLLSAIKPDARLILLGDPYQLASVQAGNVLTEICHPEVIDGFSEHRLRLLGLQSTDVVKSSDLSLADYVVMLKKSYRFDDQQGIGLLARACLNNDWQAVEQALTSDVITWLDKRQFTEQERLIELMKAHHKRVAHQSSVEQAFDTLAGFQVLTALKEGDFGAHYFNERMSTLIPWQYKAHNLPIYHGMPVMFHRNLHDLGLFNGDIGIIWKDENINNESEQLWLYVKKTNGEIQRFLPGQLQGWEPAHAITVHKSQGSEYNEVAFVSTAEGSPLNNREMLYTAITRAKTHFYCLASKAELAEAITNPTQRHSGLGELLHQR